MKTFAGRVCLITGAGSGIGRAMALELAGQGMKVGVVDIDAQAAEGVAAEARELGVEALGLPCDVSDEAGVAETFSRVAARLGPVALFCANAGVTAFERFADMSRSDLDWIYGVNLLGISRGVREVAPGMIAAGEGHVVATASMAGLVPTWAPNHAPYAATKAGIIGLMMNLRAELAEHGVGCTVVCPGGVVTDILNSPRRRPSRFGGPSAEPVRPPPGFQAPAGARYAQRTPQEVALMVLEAVRNDRPLVMTDPAMRGLYEAYSKMVLEAFDAAEDWARRNPGAGPRT